ncbi:hypothetical protein WN944_006556 [Citrus x changshan-huyou]|uniref:Uncharacterized protein n=1 Tax=Citrus x changshan-huyou TaxID=2935761 RepID=A0AAP0MJD3_9ROSI
MAVDKDKPQDEASMLRFCKITLSWDYFRLVKECCEGNDKNGKKNWGPGLKYILSGKVKWCGFCLSNSQIGSVSQVYGRLALSGGTCNSCSFGNRM